MERKRTLFVAFVALMVAFLLAAAPSYAVERKWSVSFGGGILPIISGQAGGGGDSGEGTFDYSDAFDLGWGIYGSIGYNYNQYFTAGVAGGYQTWKGSQTKGLNFDDLNVFPVLAFGKFNLMELFTDVETPWKFGFEIGAGGAYRQSVDVDNEKFWDSNWVFFAYFGPDIEYILDNGMGIGLGAGVQYVGAPDSQQGDLSDGEGFWSADVQLKLSYTW